MPRQRPGKRQRETKRAQEQQALNKLNERIHEERKTTGNERNTTRNTNRVEKTTVERQFSATEVDAIVHAAVTAAVTATVTATKELINDSKQTKKGTSNTQNDTPKTLAERITKPPRCSLAERISFPERQ
jgi:predicted membrane chloride channel (bestrophin family)